MFLNGLGVNSPQIEPQLNRKNVTNKWLASYNLATSGRRGSAPAKDQVEATYCPAVHFLTMQRQDPGKNVEAQASRRRVRRPQSNFRATSFRQFGCQPTR